jgi:diaminopimelate epimerase
MSGAGNDFILFDKKNYPGLKLNSEIIKKLCDRHNGIGADGVITIADNGSYNFVMEYFNADGSTGSLCGNGSRCAIKFAYLTGRVKNNEVSFVSNNKSYKGKVIDNDKIKFFLNEPEGVKPDLNLSAFNQTIKASFIDTGSPHVVINIEDIIIGNSEAEIVFTDIDKVPVFEIGSEIRYLREFAPGGTNVNFIKISNDKVFVRTYERGVENETYACGTGAAACALIASIKFGLKAPVTLLTKGGDELIVDFKIQKNVFSEVALTGPAKVVFTGEISETVFS